MTPKTIIITGASDGIGAAAARRLHGAGHHVVVVGRSSEKTAAVARELQADADTADFADLAAVRDLAQRLLADHPRIDVLANNAGGVFGARTVTVDGFELTRQVNHLAPFLLTNLLLERLIADRATVVQTSSVAARLYGKPDEDDPDNARRFSPERAYGDAKLANVLFTRELHTRFGRDGLHAVAFHPGFIASGFAAGTTSAGMRFVYANPIARRFLRSSDAGADQLVWLATTEPGTEWTPGAYYEKRTIAKRVNPRSTDDDLARRFWDASARAVGL